MTELCDVVAQIYDVNTGERTEQSEQSTYAFNNYFLSSYYMPCIVLGIALKLLFRISLNIYNFKQCLEIWLGGGGVYHKTPMNTKAVMGYYNPCAQPASG